MWVRFERHSEKTIQEEPCPECGAAPDQWSVTGELCGEAVVIEVTYGKCGLSIAQMIPDRRKTPR